jgi:flagellar basal body-associated protein FliL
VLYSFSFTGSTGNKTGKILAIVLPIVAVVVALAAVMICSSIWRSKRKTPEKPSLPG